jgi:hypothetical protein
MALSIATTIATGGVMVGMKLPNQTAREFGRRYR